GWASIAAKRRQKGAMPDDAAVNRAKIGSRALSPFDLTLKYWANYAGDIDAPGIDGWLRAYVKRHIPDTSADTLIAQMAQMGAIQLDDGFITPIRLENISGGASSTVDDVRDEMAQSKRGKRPKPAEDAESTSGAGKLLSTLTHSGLLVRYRGDRYL